MRIWLKCSKRFQKHKESETSPFNKRHFLNCEYFCSNIYLGKKGIVCLADRSMEVHFSYSVRDGVLVKIKSNQPYRILFDYIDGAWFINDKKSPLYNQLIKSLLDITKEVCKSNYLETYRKLEEIICVFIVGSIGNDAVY